MIKVYFETNGYAEHVATFNNEDIYVNCMPALQEECIRLGFKIVTESIEN
jgi:hypothetical protein